MSYDIYVDGVYRFRQYFFVVREIAPFLADLLDRSGGWSAMACRGGDTVVVERAQ